MRVWRIVGSLFGIVALMADDPLDSPELDAPTCETCGTVAESGICATCEREAVERRGLIRPVEP